MTGGLGERIVGSWELVSYSVTSEHGERRFPLGPDATGLIIYTSDGYMSAQIMAPGRAGYASGHVHGGTPSERSAAAHGYMAYSGPFHVDEAESTLWHAMSVSLFPNWLGDVQKRYARLDDDRLTLSADPIAFRTVTLTSSLVWQRTSPGPVPPMSGANRRGARS